MSNSRATIHARNAFQKLFKHLVTYHPALVAGTPVETLLRELSAALIAEQISKLELIDEFRANFDREVSRADRGVRTLMQGAPN